MTEGTVQRSQQTKIVKKRQAVVSYQRRAVAEVNNADTALKAKAGFKDCSQGRLLTRQME